MKVTAKTDPLTGEVEVIATWNVREVAGAAFPAEADSPSLAADILLDAERMIRAIDASVRPASLSKVA